MLTADTAQFRRDGYCVVRGLVSPDEAARLGSWASALAIEPDVPGGVMRYHEEALKDAGRLELGRIEYFRAHHQGFRRFMEAGRVPEQVSRLLGEQALLFKDKINFKAPGGAAFEPHQDAQAGWLDHCAYQVTCLVSLDATNLANGCLELAAGQHRRGLIGERGKPLSGGELAGLEFVPCETAPGDAVFFDCFVPHRSGPNTTDGARRVLYLTYNAASSGDHYEAYFAAKRKSFPPDWEREAGRAYRYRV